MFVKITFVITIISVIFIFSTYIQKNTLTTLISPLADGVVGAKKILSNINRSEKLGLIVKKSLEGTQGTYGVVVKNLKTGEYFTLNENQKFDSASLYKLWVLGTVYEKIKNNEVENDEILTRDVEELNQLFKISSESAELTEGTISLSVDQAIDRMITISDNYAALLLSARVRNSNISSFIKRHGLFNSNLGNPPQTTPADTALFFEKLYDGKIIDKESSDSMLDVLKKQKLNDRIPKYLPDEIDVAHKTGEIDGYKHDAGIIFAKYPILIVVLSESNSPQAAAERIAELSRNIYKYFE